MHTYLYVMQRLTLTSRVPLIRCADVPQIGRPMGFDSSGLLDGCHDAFPIHFFQVWKENKR
jgi:hypothetical protein